MWIDEDGIPNSVALADPATGMSAETLHDLAGLSVTERDEVIAALDAVASEVLDMDHSALAGKGTEGEPMPDGFIRSRITSAADAVKAVRGTEPFWRIDVVETLLDHLELARCASDFEALPDDLRRSGRMQRGTALWPRDRANDAAEALRGAGRRVLDLTFGHLDDDGVFHETSDSTGDWASVTWA